MAYSLTRERPLAAAWPLAALGSLARAVDRLAKARRRRLAVAALLEMDDYRLWDLGISRPDLQGMMRSDGFDVELIRDGRRSGTFHPPS
jgi:uncharacterized protein YjiS (DUF1127 family)